MVELTIQTPQQCYQITVDIVDSNVTLKITSEHFSPTTLRLHCSEQSIALEQYYFLLRIIATQFSRSIDHNDVVMAEVSFLNRLNNLINWLSESWEIVE
ncbi:hypothetical protein WOSG25_110460 [Weissella oryzae SG25]|uniref:Uncharacterized protein n=1 Tax=Weissella oryzae (strain DSM 25784 / JCM 18191 / LMG 30913 / SG25) TaxID=1329250 RepID=A0A069CWF9_WEIOS|nr:hypothetical protein [Weissella oryzae]GAK31568.1 hypothetical protein WOSG25_110460 [Weissella oryzae SG25]